MDEYTIIILIFLGIFLLSGIFLSFVKHFFPKSKLAKTTEKIMDWLIFDFKFP